MNRSRDELRIDRKQYGALINFLRGYLNQDACAEHGSAAAAALAFRKDADEREAAIVRSELEHFLSAAEDLPFSDLQRVLEQDLGSSWHFRNREELEQLRHALK